MTKRLEKRKISELKPYKNNPRKNDGAVDAVAESIKQCGYASPIIVDENLEILAGHTRYKALKQLKWKEAEVVVIEGMTEEQKRKYRILDNKTSEEAEWDIDLLAVELEDLDFEDFDFGFDDLIPDPFEEERQHQEYKENTLDMATDILNTGKATFEGVKPYDIPILLPLEELPEIDEWIGFNYILSDKRTAEEKARTGVHFYLDDYQFERVWNAPDVYMEKLAQYGVVASPDFSPIIGFPMATQIFNHYRKHWCGAYWQANGLTVIPTITGSVTEQPFYLDGEPEDSVILTSAMWTDMEGGKKLFLDSWDDMIQRLKPRKIIVYGKLPKEADRTKCAFEEIATFANRRFKSGE